MCYVYGCVMYMDVLCVWMCYVYGCSMHMDVSCICMRYVYGCAIYKYGCVCTGIPFWVPVTNNEKFVVRLPKLGTPTVALHTTPRSFAPKDFHYTLGQPALR